MAKENQPTGTYDPATGTFTPAAPAKKKHPINIVLIILGVLLLYAFTKCVGGMSEKESIPVPEIIPATEADAESPPAPAETDAPETEAPAVVAEPAKEPEKEKAPEPEPAKEPETEAKPAPEPEPEPEPKPGTPEYNRAYIEKHENEIIAAAVLTMDASGEEYEFPTLAPQKWTTAMFDSSAVITASDITFRGKPGDFVFVAELQFDAKGKMIGTTNHYIEAGGIILYTDHYCDDVNDKLLGRNGNPEKIEGAFVKEGYDPDGSYMAAVVEGEAIEIYWMADRGQTMALYWAGTFTQPTGAEEYTFDSVNDTAKTASALLASSDPTKTMTVKNGTISFSVTVQGVTSVVRLVPWGGGIS